MEASTSSSSGDGSGRGYEVFLSFRGPDTRLTIADCLYNDMIRAGIRAFKDNEELRFGEEIGGGLLHAINESRIYIPIFSKDYASSKWCLRELARIVELSRDNDEKVILPIFYDVDADDVKLKTKLYQEALRKHESESGKDLAKKWKEALREVAKIRGRNLKDHGLDKLKNLTVKEVSSLLWTRRIDAPDRLVGIKDRMDEIMKQLYLGAFDVRFIVIHGMGGIGKTTLAEAIFRKISPQFQGHCCFLKDVRTHDMINLQSRLLSDILNLKCTNLSFIDEGVDMIKTRFHGKKVLIVLDDIDNQDQIMRLVGEPNWYGGGSRIIITTRTIEFLVKEGEDGDVPTSDNGHFSFYTMPEMNRVDALQLFCERALGRAKPPPDYIDISEKLVNALGRLPLALDVVGSTLRGKRQSTWENVLRKLKKVMNEDVKKKLMISYKALDPTQQQIYLDIACFFINQEKTTAIKYWDAIFGYSTEIEVKILTRMSLIKTINNDKTWKLDRVTDKLWMHDQLRDLGRDIVRLESQEIHLRGSRLWSLEDATRVVQSKMGNENVVALNLGIPESDVTYNFKRKEFARMVNLRFLQLDHGNFEGDFKNLFTKLRWLSWSNCPSKFQASNFGLENLAVLKLSLSNITEDWGGWCQIMVSKQLKVLQLEHCPSLTKAPEFSTISQLERLILKCIQLREIDESIGNLQNLDYLEIESGEIESLPKSIGDLKSLTELRIKSGRLSVLPYSIGNLVKLKDLILICPELRELPDSIGQLESLLVMVVYSTRIGELPYSIGNLERLKILILAGSSFSGLPTTINQLTNLQQLDLELCHSIRRLPELPKRLTSLKISSVSLTTITDLTNLTNLVDLYIVGTSVQEPNNIEGLGRLRALKDLTLLVGKMTWPPTDLSSLSQLRKLCITYVDPQSLTGLPSSLQSLTLKLVQSAIDSSLFSNLENLSTLSIVGYHTLGEIRFDLLKTLTLPPCLKEIRDLELRLLPQLIEIQGLGELRSLHELRIESCNSLKSLNESDLSKLRNLKRLILFGCGSLEHVLGVPESCRLHVQACPRLKRDG